jgi:Uma2 family endonuclease
LQTRREEIAVSSSPWPDHLLTLEDWERLPEDTSRHYELAEGVLHVAPRPVPRHQVAMARLFGQLDAQLPAEWAAVADSEMIVESGPPATIRAPDVLVVPQRAIDDGRPRFAAVDVLVAVEIVSPGTGRVDRVTKFAEYADAGIEHYWIVDLTEPVDLIAYRLIDGDYESVASGSGVVVVESPARLTVDLPALVASR